MSSTAAGGAHLENVMYRLMDLAGENADQYDTMIMLSLVNLLGIISVMNKQGAAGVSAPRSLGEDPLAAALLKMLGDQQMRPAAREGGPPSFNPALLMSLLGPQAQKPENALLLALLTKMMQPPQGPPVPEKNRQGPADCSGGFNRAAGGVRKEPGRPAEVLNWDRRLG
ncbi:MAG: hypothetical protein K6T66_02690 [Peptococcaceae bacterium]|nr:hypothetical protein [Peptococcaceae bacterium]